MVNLNDMASYLLRPYSSASLVGRIEVVGVEQESQDRQAVRVQAVSHPGRLRLGTPRSPR